jgi:hypothetical protein
MKKAALIRNSHNSEMLIARFNQTLDIWLSASEGYSFEQLCARPSPVSWSAGQLYRHLIDDTGFFIEQIKVCVDGNDAAEKQPTPFGLKMLTDNDFPDEAIVGASGNDFIPQPLSKEQLVKDMEVLKISMNAAALLIDKSPFKGKSKHPGLGYFNAEEWLQFAEMHLRHHLRQKKRIDAFLKTI